MSERCRHGRKIALHADRTTLRDWRVWWCPECGAICRKLGAWRYPEFFEQKSPQRDP